MGIATINVALSTLFAIGVAVIIANVVYAIATLITYAFVVIVVVDYNFIDDVVASSIVDVLLKKGVCVSCVCVSVRV